MNRLLPAIALALALAVTLTPPLPAGETPPNIVFILADDLGYGDLGCTGHPYVKSPTIDQLARDGSHFRQFYVGGATCCPSRTAFMTGRRPAGFAKYPATHGFSGAVTVSDLLKKAGYRTGHFGKWHIGDEQKNGTYGFDTIQIAVGTHKDPRGRDAGIADAAIDFIKANKAAPFFANVWFHTVHNPVNPPQSFVDQFKGLSVKPTDFKSPDLVQFLNEKAKAGEDIHQAMRQRCGDILQLDGQVARVLKALDDADLRKNTLVLFTGDNGPNAYGSAGPYREGKHSLYDGGIHNSLIVRWPDHVSTGRVDDKCVLAGVDWLPTLATIAGAKGVPTDIDGEDVSDIWLGKERERRTDLCFRASAPRDTPTIRRGSWKLHVPARPKGEVELYDLSRDPGERENVAAKHPEVVKELSAALKRWTATLPTMYDKGEDKDP